MALVRTYGAACRPRSCSVWLWTRCWPPMHCFRILASVLDLVGYLAFLPGACLAGQILCGRTASAHHQLVAPFC